MRQVPCGRCAQVRSQGFLDIYKIDQIYHRGNKETQLKKRMYVVEVSDGKTLGYWEDDLKVVAVDIKEGDEEKKVVLDTDENVLAFMPGGAWHSITFVKDFLGEDDAKIQMALSRPRKSDTAEYAALNSAVKQEFLSNQRPARWNAVILAQAVREWTFPEEITEEGVQKLPRNVYGQLVEFCEKRYYTHTEHPSFLQNSWSKQSN